MKLFKSPMLHEARLPVFAERPRGFRQRYGCTPAPAPVSGIEALQLLHLGREQILVRGSANAADLDRAA